MLSVVKAGILILGVSTIFIGIAQIIDSSWGPDWLDTLGTSFMVVALLLILQMRKLINDREAVDAD